MEGWGPDPLDEHPHLPAYRTEMLSQLPLRPHPHSPLWPLASAPTSRPSLSLELVVFSQLSFLVFFCCCSC